LKLEPSLTLAQRSNGGWKQLRLPREDLRHRPPFSLLWDVTFFLQRRNPMRKRKKEINSLTWIINLQCHHGIVVNSTPKKSSSFLNGWNLPFFPRWIGFYERVDMKSTPFQPSVGRIPKKITTASTFSRIPSTTTTISTAYLTPELAACHLRPTQEGCGMCPTQFLVEQELLSTQ